MQSRTGSGSVFVCCFLLCCIGWVDQVAAQADSTVIDSTRTGTWYDISLARVQYFSADSFGAYHEIDTSLHQFQVYHHARKDLFENTWLGNLGSPVHSRWFNYDRAIGFDYGRHERDVYLFTPDNVHYYRCNVPYTDLFYVVGSNSEQLFHVTHAHNFGPDLNLSIDYEKIASTGYYQYSSNTYSDVALTGWYTAAHKRYAAYMTGIRGKNTNDENGGVNNDTVFDFPNPDLADIFRSVASTQWDNWQGEIRQQVFFGKHIQYAVNDTESSTIFSPKWVLEHSFGVHTFNYLFEDPEENTNYYGPLFASEDTLRDQINVQGLYNELRIHNVDTFRVTKDSITSPVLQYEAHMRQQYHVLSDQSGNMHYQNLIMGGILSLKDLGISGLYVSALGDYDLQVNDYTGALHLDYHTKALHFSAAISMTSLEPTVIQQHYYGFSMRYENTFSDVRSRGAQLGIEMPGLQTALHVGLQQYQNFVYFSGYPQVEKNISVRSISLQNTLQIGDFYLHSVAGLQSVSGPIDLPVFLANISWYYKKAVFAKALILQTGVDAWYCSDYDPYIYSIVNGQFNTGHFAEWEYPFQYAPVIDVYASFDVRTLRFFAKLENAAQGLYQKGYYEAPYYPCQPRSFKLGFNWMLFY